MNILTEIKNQFFFDRWRNSQISYFKKKGNKTNLNETLVTKKRLATTNWKDIWFGRYMELDTTLELGIKNRTLKSENYRRFFFETNAFINAVIGFAYFGRENNPGEKTNKAI